MHKIDVSLNNNTYDILIAQGIEKSIENFISNLGSYNKVFIITQQSIINIYKFSKLLLCGYDILIVNEGQSNTK
jgi:3-dehydroquinate synthetase